MNKDVIFLGVIAVLLLAWTSEPSFDGGIKQSINPTLYSRFIQRKGQGIGSRGWYQFVYTNEIYFLLAPFATTVSPAVKDPFLYELYELAETVITKGENNFTFTSTLSGWLQNRFPSLDGGIRNEVINYEKKLFTVSTKLWNGKPLQ